ncbi:MAG: cyclic nucleotide-binding domain-containing protein [Parachlamydiales bacterium]|jgi:CRP-like cAMP-binding protein
MKELSLIEKAFFLKKVPLFEELDLDLLVAISDKMHQDFFDAKDKIFEVNGKASRMYFIVQGEIELLDKENQPFQILSATNFFGDEALFAGSQREYQARCLKETLLLTLSKTNLFNVISECPSIAIALLSHYAQKTLCRHCPV